ncbi:MAG TPA: CBS domain-containing protein [Verrucomicrobiae bacterium]|jgi:CBS domain-containing protein
MKIGGTVGEILRTKGATVWSIPPTTTVFDAIKCMADRDVGALPVVDGNQVVGILSERDYTRKVVLQGKSSKQTSVGEIMSRDPQIATPNSTVEECMALMTQKRVRHLPVVADGKLVGIVSIGDLVKWTISAQDAALKQMENYISGSYYA